MLEVAHEHAWTPVDGERGRYFCECGGSASRDLLTGAIEVRRGTRVEVEVEVDLVPWWTDATYFERRRRFKIPSILKYPRAYT